MEKSHVTMAYKICKITGEKFDDGLLLDKRLKKVFERETCAGFGISPRAQKMIDKGYIALVGIDPERSSYNNEDHVKPSDVWRTGDLIWMKRDAFEGSFDTSGKNIQEMVFCTPDMIEELKSRMHPDDKQ
jgi:hypothetical protein